ncbi:MAG: hypothetical protein V3U33_04815 [candidate division NC10 bacterium]
MVKRLLTLIITISLLVGTSAMAAAAEHDFETKGFYDYPLRWAVYAIHPVGWVLDNFVAKPLTFFACIAPNVTGCTSHERRSLGLDDVDLEVSSEE